ncbi:LytTR family DNA-binding domain-containing protein [Chryseobacterium herbae]|uniref:LytTR family transcriptional regulator n=1 Tax=Chryseobacterium herbae TaxID=2976476 RepID=A0ABT2IW68_9FLAO|nr:LytTR family DNA-binding domain-containing protein [Chryseobacterium sp. pc1-10]MCT2563062.1 LytTR family transcriptional regulator [Chryseobacterium sp. pc1-10]
MLSFAAYPYPKSDSYKEILVSSMVAGLLFYIFLIVFQPFGTENFHHQYKYLLLFPYSLIFGTSFFIADFCIIRFKDWNIGFELLKLIGIIFLASILSYFYNTLVISHVKLSFINFLYMFLYCLALGIPISTIYVLSRYIYLKSIHERTADQVSKQLADYHQPTDHKFDTTLNIAANQTNLQIPENYFICAQSMENYCSVYFIEDHIVKKVLIRISLSDLLNQIQTDKIKRCHRSYILNLNHVKSLKGNAQGYKLFLSEIDFEIPVSRSFISLIIPRLKDLKT